MEVWQKFRRSPVFPILIIIALAALLAPKIIQPAESDYTGMAKPMEFYFHYVDTPVTVAGLQTKYIMNTTRDFRFLTQQEAHANSLYKPIGQPKIVLDFYLYPNLAGPVTFNGTWQVFAWLNGSAYKPTTFTLSFKEITRGGVLLWDSGSLNPTVTSSVGSYIDVPVYNYNLSVPLAHTFEVGTTILVEFEINAGSSADTRFWYDSPGYPSKVILPAQDYARPISIKTYSVDNSETTVFHYNWSEGWRKVIVRANITDPYGGYDINTVNISILDPTGLPVLDNVEMTRKSDGQWRINYLHQFEANWSYPITAALGNYTVVVIAVDNNGYYHHIDYGSFEPFTEEETHIFTIGVVVYYDPTIIVTDDVDDVLPNAQVYVTWLNGTTDTFPRYTSTNGSIKLARILAGDYGFTILWKDKIVKKANLYIGSDGPHVIKTEVYQLTVKVYGNNGRPIHGAYVIVDTQSGVGYGLDTTDETGKAIFKLPSGIYQISAHYTTNYWLTVLRPSASESISVTSSTSKDIIFTDFPPPVWSTIQFWLLTASILVASAAIIFVLIIRRRS